MGYFCAYWRLTSFVKLWNVDPIFGDGAKKSFVGLQLPPLLPEEPWIAVSPVRPRKCSFYVQVTTVRCLAPRTQPNHRERVNYASWDLLVLMLDAMQSTRDSIVTERSQCQWNWPLLHEFLLKSPTTFCLSGHGSKFVIE